MELEGKVCVGKDLHAYLKGGQQVQRHAEWRNTIEVTVLDR